MFFTVLGTPLAGKKGRLEKMVISQASPWDGYQVWVLGFAQERTQKRVMVKRRKVR